LLQLSNLKDVTGEQSASFPAALAQQQTAHLQASWLAGMMLSITADQPGRQALHTLHGRIMQGLQQQPQ